MSIVAVNDFNSKVRFLLGKLKGHLPRDADVDRLCKRAMVIIDTLPTAPVSRIGPYLLKYQDDIYCKNQKYKRFFSMESPFQDEVRKEAESPSEAQAALGIISKLQGIARLMSDADQQEYIETLQDMLQAYCDFVEAKK